MQEGIHRRDQRGDECTGTYVRRCEDSGNNTVSRKQWEDKEFWKDEATTKAILPGKIGSGSHGGSGGLASIPTSRELLSN